MIRPELREMARKRLGNIKARCSSKGRECTLTLHQVMILMAQKRCFYTGIELNHEHPHPAALTIDRVDAGAGYKAGNVVACALGVNQAKGWMLDRGIGVPEVRLIQQGVERHRQKFGAQK